MTMPKTLLEMAGAPSAPPPLDRSALVLIDCQMEYVTGALALPGVDAALDEAARLLELARAERVPVVHVVHHGRPGGGLFDPEGEFAAIAGQVAPAPGEPVITKALPNAFAGTGLDDQLKEFERTELILAGFMTHMCVSSSARASSELGYRATVVAAAAATRDLPDGRGGVIKADDLHRAELAALSDRFAVIIGTTDELKG
ncbi:MAG: isochorismatase family protein [Rhodospirillales bacterium]|jgi:nicotinamidase-related amidase|nr:isochorismatase family protein [Rhodospirillales bacterium]MDP6774487.1 isochorismatase family protein [Rhodospirillales bacterium]